jgi:cold shock CspA family protein
MPDSTFSNSPLPQIDYTRLTGSIRRLKEGFGFIAGDDGTDYFFHWSAMEKSTKDFRELELRHRVSFQTAVGKKGLRAICVRVEE